MTKKYQFLGREFLNPIIIAPCPAVWTANDLIGLAKSSGAAIITTKSVTVNPRKGNAEPREYYWGRNSLNAVGLANDGIDEHLKYVKIAQESVQTPFILSVAGFSVNEYVVCAQKANQNQDLLAIELNLSCPNTESELFIDNLDAVRAILEQIKKVSKHKVGVKVNPESDLGKIESLLRVFADFGVDYVVCSNTVGGGFMLNDQNQSAIAANGGFGGLGGAQVQAVSLATLKKYQEISQKVGFEGAFVGLGGVWDKPDAEKYQALGASMVGVATRVMIEGEKGVWKLTKAF